MSHDGIDTLLELDGEVIVQEGGYWLKIKAWRVDANDDIPHGIRYSLTLHKPTGERILGYDNAHAVPPGNQFKYAGRKLPYDHKHRHAKDVGVPYHFEDAYQLMSDFFAEVDRVLQEVKAR